MSRKFTEARKQAFLAAVRETGNQTIAAERAKVSRAWVQLHRSTDPGFKAAVAAAVAEAKERLRKGPHPIIGAAALSPGQGQEPSDPASGRGEGSNAPPSGWGFLDGEELVVRGTGGSGGGKRVQIARARLKRWTPRAEARFLRALAATCNVKAACRAVGLSKTSAYNHRKRWPAFDRRWDEAIVDAYWNVDEALTTSGIAGLDPYVELTALPIPPMSVDDAIRVMRLHQRRALGFGKWPGLRRRG